MYPWILMKSAPNEPINLEYVQYLQTSNFPHSQSKSQTNSNSFLLILPMPHRAWIIFPLVFTWAYIWLSSTMSSPTSSSYNEETITTQINTIYNLLLKLSYFTPDRINFPPKDGHAINEELCHSLHLTPEVISLMKRIPYVMDGYHKPIIWQSRAFEYTLDEEIRNGRDPERTDAAIDEDKLRMDFLRPWELALTCWLDDGISVILDTKSSTFSSPASLVVCIYSVPD